MRRGAFEAFQGFRPEGSDISATVYHFNFIES
jgi:hypothetical protein